MHNWKNSIKMQILRELLGMLDFCLGPGEEIIFTEIEKLCEIYGHQSKMVVLWPIHTAILLPGSATF